MKKKFLILVMLTAFMFTLGMIEVHGEEEIKTIKIAYPIQDGLTMVTKDGEYYGYTYEYIKEIGKYTGWKYEFVRLEGGTNQQIVQAMTMLQKGEVDLVGGLNYSEELTSMFVYPGQSYGTNYKGIFVPYNSPISEISLYTMGKIKVGVFKQNNQPDESLEQFAKMNQINIEQHIVGSSAQLEELLNSGEVDAVLSSDLAVYEHQGMRSIAHFSPKPFYFASTIGNADITRQVDYAIGMINQVTPNFSLSLYNKYFSSYATEVRLTEQEKAYISSNPVKEIVLYGNKAPYSYMDEETGKMTGILVDVLAAISENTGLQFNIRSGNNGKEMTELAKSGQVDVVGDLLLGHAGSVDTGKNLTLPWHSMPMSMIMGDGTFWQSGGKMVAPSYLENLLTEDMGIQFYDTVEECIRQVQRGNADYVYIDEYSAQYHLNSGKYPKLKMQKAQDSDTQQMGFGVVKDGDDLLLSVLNKSISILSNQEVEEIIYRNTYKHQNISWETWMAQNDKLIMVTVMGIIIMLLAAYALLKSRERRKIAFENQRFNVLSSMSNEFFYEYDTAKDELIVQDNCAEYFSCDRMIEDFNKELQEIPKDDRRGIWSLGEHIVDGKEGEQEVSCIMANGSHQWFRLMYTEILGKDRDVHIIGKIVDIQRAKMERMRLEQKAFTDGLTGVYNFTAIKNKVEHQLKKAEECKPSGLIIMDIDNFKHINDEHGHYTGDAVLIQLAECLTEVFSPSPVGRLGGDEFIVFTEKLSQGEIEHRCTLLNEMFGQRTEDLLGYPASVSIGITMVIDAEDFDTLYKEADYALYKRKSSKKGGYCFYDESKPGKVVCGKDVCKNTGDTRGR